MKILLVGNLPEDGQESMARFTALLHDGLRARGHSVAIIAPTLHLARLAGPYRYRGLPKYLGYFDKFGLFPRILRQHIRNTRPDVVHFTDQAGAVYSAAARGTRMLATCHDLLQVRAARGEFEHQAVGLLGRRYQEWILAHLARLPRIVCISTKTRADVLRLTGQAPDRVSLVPNALNFPYQPVTAATAQQRLAGLAVAGEKFLLHVGGSQWYKNRPGVLAIYAELRRRLPDLPALVLVGRPFSAAEAAEISRRRLHGQMIRLSDVSNIELEALYSLAEGLIFPSWEEGFGWPIAEAQACGCPVFTSDRAPMNEVGGTAAVYFDPADPAGAAKIIALAWPDRPAQRTRGLLESARWQPEIMLTAYEKIYRELAPA